MQITLLIEMNVNWSTANFKLDRMINRIKKDDLTQSICFVMMDAGGKRCRIFITLTSYALSVFQ